MQQRWLFSKKKNQKNREDVFTVPFDEMFDRIESPEIRWT